MAGVDNLRIAGDDRDPRSAGGTAHGLRDDTELVQRHTLLQDEPDRQGEGLRAADREVVDGAVDREVAHVAAGEEAGPDHVGVGGEGEPPTSQIEDRCVAELFEHTREVRASEGRQEQVLHQFAGQPATATVPHDDGRLVTQRQWARPVLQVRTIGHADTSRRRNW
jgi:hypothetical protein